MKKALKRSNTHLLLSAVMIFQTLSMLLIAFQKGAVNLQALLFAAALPDLLFALLVHLDDLGFGRHPGVPDQMFRVAFRVFADLFRPFLSGVLLKFLDVVVDDDTQRHTDRAEDARNRDQLPQ